jgi:hypothetical protein
MERQVNGCCSFNRFATGSRLGVTGVIPGTAFSRCPLARLFGVVADVTLAAQTDLIKRSTPA